MGKNIEPLRDRYAEALDLLVERGKTMLKKVQSNVVSDTSRAVTTTRLKYVPEFHDGYQTWYSESYAVIKQLMPDRLDDFVGHYRTSEPKATRLVGNLLRGAHRLSVHPGIAHLRQQVAIVEAVRARLESSLYNIRDLVRFDLFDSELDAARELLKKGFLRSAGVLAGVVLERHLGSVCGQHAIPIKKKRPSISDLNDLLRNSGVVDVPQWRFVQHLADVRNLCGHKREKEPERAEVDDMISGVAKVIKTVF